jgi:hypothetical protein
MSINSRELENQADLLESKARNLLKEKKYSDAIAVFNEALNIYTELGWEGQIGMLKKEIQRIENLKKIMGDDKSENVKVIVEKKPDSQLTEGQKKEREIMDKMSLAKHHAFSKNYDEAIKLYKEAVEFYEALNYVHQVRELKWQILKWEKERELRDKDINDYLAQTQERRDEIAKEREKRVLEEQAKRKELEEEMIQQRIREQQELQELNIAKYQPEPKKKDIEEMKKSRLAIFEAKKMGVDLDTYETERKKMEQKKLEIMQKEAREKEVLAEIEILLEKAKNKVDNHKFHEAKEFYSKAKDLFLEIGWNQQAETMQEELNNLDSMQKAYEEKLRLQREQMEKEQLQYKQREEEYKRAQKAKLDEMERKKKDLTPEQKQKLETINMLMEKAKSNEAKEKYDLALGRYEYILELLKEIPIQVLNVEEIKSKIEELKNKTATA